MASLGYDLENARTIVSFGAPLLDGWGTPGRFTRLWSERAAGAADPQLRLIQIEPSLSRTAARAWRWVPDSRGKRSGTCRGRGAGSAGRSPGDMRRGPCRSYRWRKPLRRRAWPPRRFAILRTRWSRIGPVVVIAADGNPAIAALNVLLGAVGAPGGIVRKREDVLVAGSGWSPSPARFAPCWLIRPCLGNSLPQPMPRYFVSRRGMAAGTQQVGCCPLPDFWRNLRMCPRRPLPLARPMPWPRTWPRLQRKSRAPHSSCSRSIPLCLQWRKSSTRVARKFSAPGRARSMESTRSRSAKIDSAQHLEEQLRKGAVWMGDPPGPGKLRCELKEWPADSHVAHATNWAAAWAPPVLPALATKLYQESNLRELPAGRQA